MDRIRTARNGDAKQQIVYAAQYSFVGEMIYRKMNRNGKGFTRKRYKVIPIDCGVTTLGNNVLFAQDYSDNKQVKMFIINQIERFEPTLRKAKPAFPIRVDRIKEFFGVV